MAVEKKIFLQVEEAFIIRDRQGDLSKQWYVEYWLGGKRKRRYGNINQFPTRKGRREAAEELRLRMIQEYGDQILQERLTDKELLFQTLELKRKERNWRLKTYRGHVSKLNTFFSFLGKEDFSKKDVERFFEYLAESKHPTTYNGYWVKMKFLLGFIGKGHYLEGIYRGAPKYTPLKYFQPHQRDQLSDYISENDQQLFLAICLMYYAALRPGELRVLKVQDIYFDEELIFVEGKTAKTGTQRYITITENLLPILEPLKKKPANSYIFPSTWKLNSPNWRKYPIRTTPDDIAKIGIQ